MREGKTEWDKTCCEIKKMKHDRSLVRETEWSDSDEKKQKQQRRINKDEKLGEGKQR